MPKFRHARTRILAGLLVGVLTLTGCGGALAGSIVTGDEPGDNRPVVATTFTVLADMTRRIAGDRVVVESVTSPGVDVHRFDPTVSDLRRVADADLIVSNGLGMDDWLLRFLDGTATPHVVASAGIDPLPVRSGSHSGRPDPHAWMSPTEGRAYIATLTRALTDLDPAGSGWYAERARDYAAEVEATGARARAVIAALPPERRVLVSCEGAFSYLARDLGLDEHYLWPVNTESQGLPRQVTDLVDAVRDREVPAVFCESTVSSAPMEQVAADTGARLAGTLYVDSLSRPDGPVPTYLDLLRHDLDTITGGLSP